MTGYLVTFAASAKRELRDLPTDVIGRLLPRIRESEESPPVGCKKLQGYKDRWRIRVGDYRVVYTVDDGARVVDITRIAHCKDDGSRIAMMNDTLSTVIGILRAHEGELLRFGVAHAAVFGSVARGEAGADSDIDILVDLDRQHPMGVFEYARLKIYINELFNGDGDVVNRRTLKPLLRDSILRDCVNAF